MFERIFFMLRKEFIQTLRDPRMLRVILAVPVVQTLIFGYAVTTDIKRIPTVFYDLDNSVESRDLISRFVKSGYFVQVPAVGGEAKLRKMIDHGDVKAVLKILRGFGGEVQGGKTAVAQLLIDGTDSNTAGIIISYAAGITGSFNDQVLQQRQSRIFGRVLVADSVRLETRAWFNENLESRNFYVPGVIALLVTLVSLMLSGMAVVREKEIGTIEQIMVTPITRAEFILGKTTPFAVIAFVDVTLITVVSVFWFNVPIRGNILILFLATGVYLMTTLGFGLLISTISRTQQQAMMSTFLIFFPSVLLSGFMFPIANMPRVVQWFTLVNPLRYILVIIRGIFLKGVGLEILWPQIAALAVLGVVVLTLASLRFQKTLS